MVEVTSGFEMREQIYSKLFAHQREGVAWLWGLHCKKKGGILADDMGLGKTVQVRPVTLHRCSARFDLKKPRAQQKFVKKSVGNF